ncbi:MAG: hypothetical protein HP496_00565 [Nitrospira sp.]|nr:hypothetical protein [Nitrospira sp.]
MSPLVFVGIDVSQTCLDIAIRPGVSFSKKVPGSDLALCIVGLFNFIVKPVPL